jgi:hypothetical protein
MILTLLIVAVAIWIANRFGRLRETIEDLERRVLALEIKLRDSQRCPPPPPMLAAVGAEAKLGPEERARPVLLAEQLERPAGRRFVFWLALSLVVIALLAVIARLLPKALPPSP